MTRGTGLLTRALDRVIPIYHRLVWGLEALIPLFDLSVRLYLAHIFWKGGMVKLSSWMSTVMLFTMVYDVPLLPPEMAAYVTTAVELGGSCLLAVGLAGRWAALALFGLNIVASISYGQVSEAALQEAFYVGVLFLYFVLHGSGRLSADSLAEYLIRRRHSTRIAEGDGASHPVLGGR
ncbi:DoxX family protein (modular protein) [Candidatus Nitrospira nitrosa]|uniref:DoxX family protein (Modular protein) n=1 Tax=Candidatus Nitrospira nitrosa TaxID=1742972 RepID=A0A0S4L7W9_9BACT|nr:DoxX family protein [Candidatus Nitrospira nitrosa]CUS31979.1 DoxX family protein (modular protein) [Candidatus Nitrospira nitrosa]